MSEEKKNETQDTKEQSTQEAAKPVTLDSMSKGTMQLVTPIRAKSSDVTELQYDFKKLTGMEYVEAMDSDPNAKNVFKVTAKQALCLFAVAAGKVTDDLDATDIKERIGVADTVKAVQLATVFLVASAREANKNSSGV